MIIAEVYPVTVTEVNGTVNVSGVERLEYPDGFLSIEASVNASKLIERLFEDHINRKGVK